MSYIKATHGIGKFASFAFRILPLIAFLTVSHGCSSSIREADPEIISTSVSDDRGLLRQTRESVESKSAGCLDCHTDMDSPTMHRSPSVRLGCVDCHGGKATVRLREGAVRGEAPYSEAKQRAHVQPRYPEEWKTSANPERTDTLLNRERPEYIQFINPGDLRVADKACGACHAAVVEQVRKSLMTTSSVFWAAAAYNNGILPNKESTLGESYSHDGVPQKVQTVPPPTEAERQKGVLPYILPLPRWEVIKPGDPFRVFEDGGLRIPSIFPDVGNPDPFEEGGRPDIRQSVRGLGTGLRISVPILNIHKTRLNNPHLSFLGTNDHPGDYRSSGCTACHVLYANDRDPFHSGPYAVYGNRGESHTGDPTIPRNESGHPIKHELTRAIPTSQCMVCHHHQPNVFMNSYLGYQMWDYEADGEVMWPKEQRYPTAEETWKSLIHNPEEAATRGLWTDTEFLTNVWELNPQLKHTQFADYHGHGWNFRAVFKRDRKGNLLDAGGKIIPWKTVNAEKLQRAIRETTEKPEERKGIPVHLKDIHLEKGMHCVDCHFAQDNHGNGKLYGEYANAIEISCVDCHGTINEKAALRTSGPAAPNGGHNLLLLRSSFGMRRFVWQGDKLIQRSMVTEGLEWEVVQVRDSINPTSQHYNEKSRLAKTLLKDGKNWGTVPNDPEQLAHSNDRIECFSCHLSWTTSCAGCHLPIQANWMKTMNHFEGSLSRNWATYNLQVARNDQFILGIHGSIKGGKIAPVRSSSALVVSSTNVNRERIYIQQPPISSAGYSSQAFNPHFPHTVRTTETKTCTDCHLSSGNDNNAWLQSVLGQGTNFVNFMGRYIWVAEGQSGLEGVAVTEWDEPQAVIGSYLHQLAYPDDYRDHKKNGDILQETYHHSGANILGVQLRGEYLYTANGPGGFRVYDVANIDNKGFSERIVTAPVSPLGQRTYVKTTFATAVALPTTMPVDPTRCYRETGWSLTPSMRLPGVPCRPENQEQPVHELYRYAYVTDRYDGLIIVNVDTLSDRDPKNNYLHRVATYNPDGILDGAINLTVAGNYAYILCDRGLAVISIEDPFEPRLVAEVSAPFINKPRAIEIQFRYAFVLDEDGLKVIDVTFPERARAIQDAALPLAEANDIYIARTYAYVAGGKEGLVTIDIERPEHPFVDQTYDAEGAINDARGVKVATTNASLFAYVADGRNGLRVIQLTSPNRTPAFYGFSPRPAPKLIATYPTHGPALAISKGLDRDRAVDESGNQVSIFGRIGSRPFNLEEMRRLFLRDAKVYQVTDTPPGSPSPFSD